MRREETEDIPMAGVADATKVVVLLTETRGAASADSVKLVSAIGDGNSTS